MKRILLVDNYDSFTYNLAYYLEALGCSVATQFNDTVDLSSLFDFDAIVLSPGPGLPSEAGLMPEIIKTSLGKIPVFGVCLGMQGMAEFLDAEIYNQSEVKHGVQEEIGVSQVSLFNGVGECMEVGLYHSWAVSEDGNFEVIARSKSGKVMAIQNEVLLCYGVQFHPESIMTPKGRMVLENFLATIK